MKPFLPRASGWLAAIAAMAATISAWAQTETKLEPSKLLVDGKPYEIRGVTYSDPPTDEDFKKMAEMGVNTIRTWGTGERTPALLDMAQKYRMKVMLGIWMRYGKPSMEDSDAFDWVASGEGKMRQLDSALAVVAKYKDHPALLGWGIGNEVTLNIPNEEAKVAYARFLERVCREIRKIDTKHPLASISAWTTDVPYWQQYCPSLAYLYGITAYGHAALAAPEALRKLGVTKPFFFGEFGVMGEWEMGTDANGVKRETSDKTKYETYTKLWPEIKARGGGRMVGGFFYNFGHRLTFTGVRMDFLVGDAYRPIYWGARKALTGNDALNEPPEIGDFVMDGSDKPQKAKEWVEAKAMITDKEGSPVDVSFYYNQRAGDGAQRNAVKELKSEPGGQPGTYRIQMPASGGPAKIYLFAKDDYPNLSIATTSVVVTP